MRLHALGLAFALGAPIGCASSSSPSSSSAASSPSSSASVPQPDPRQEDVEGLMPAGLCGFYAYLGTPCGDRDAPRAAIVMRAPAPSNTSASARALLGDMPDTSVKRHARMASPEEIARAESLLAKAKDLDLAAGYPFALDWHDLPARDAKRRGIAIIVGLFTTTDAAKAWLGLRPKIASSAMEVVDLAEAGEWERRRNPADGDYVRFLGTRRVVVEIMEPATALDARAVDAIFDRGQTTAERDDALKKLTPACTVSPGRLFVSNLEEVYAANREYAPVDCGRTRAYVPWSATRLESVVTRPVGAPAMFHQVVEVSCDSPRVESRPFGSKRPAALVAFSTCRG